MLWNRKSDPLVEKTLALVQGVAKADSPENSGSFEVEPRAVLRAEPVTESNLAKPKGKLFEVDEEMKIRLSEFKAVQQRFAREREEFYEKTMQKVRPSPGRNGG
jgi:hypothetical protein